MFHGKSKPSVEYMLSGNAGWNMNESGGVRMGIDGVDDGFASIGNVAFPFFGLELIMDQVIIYNGRQIM